MIVLALLSAGGKFAARSSKWKPLTDYSARTPRQVDVGVRKISSDLISIFFHPTIPSIGINSKYVLQLTPTSWCFV